MSDLFGTEIRNHDGYTRVEYTGPPTAPKPHREGLRRERATDTRDEAYRRYQAKSPKAAGLTRDAANVLNVVCKYGPITDLQVSRRITAAKGKPFPPGRVSARRAELVDHEAGALVEKAGTEKDPETGGTGTLWCATGEGRALLQQLLHR